MLCYGGFFINIDFDKGGKKYSKKRTRSTQRRTQKRWGTPQTSKRPKEPGRSWERRGT
jgi:hypothetical protein